MMKLGNVVMDKYGVKYIVDSFDDELYDCVKLGSPDQTKQFKEVDVEIIDYEDDMITPKQKKVGMKVQRKNKSDKSHRLVAQRIAQIKDTANRNPVNTMNVFYVDAPINIPNSMD